MSTKKNNYKDKDISTNLLISLKHMKAEFNTFTQEASNEDLFQQIEEIYLCVSRLQRDVFDMMCEQGWYVMKSDTSANISKAYTKYANSKKDLS